MEGGLDSDTERLGEIELKRWVTETLESFCEGHRGGEHPSASLVTDFRPFSADLYLGFSSPSTASLVRASVNLGCQRKRGA